jgi:hypothetical protein
MPTGLAPEFVAEIKATVVELVKVMKKVRRELKALARDVWVATHPIPASSHNSDIRRELGALYQPQPSTGEQPESSQDLEKGLLPCIITGINFPASLIKFAHIYQVTWPEETLVSPVGVNGNRADRRHTSKGACDQPTHHMTCTQTKHKPPWMHCWRTTGQGRHRCPRKGERRADAQLG